MIRLFLKELRKTLCSGFFGGMLMLCTMIALAALSAEISSTYHNYGSKNTTGYVNEQGKPLSVSEVIRNEAAIRSAHAGKMDEKWLESFLQAMKQARQKSLLAGLDETAMEQAYGPDWKEEYLQDPDAFYAPYVSMYPEDAELDEAAAEREKEHREMWEQEIQNKKELLYLPVYENNRSLGKPADAMESDVLEMDWLCYVEPLMVRKVYTFENGIDPDNYNMDMAGQQVEMSVWPMIGIDDQELSYYQSLLEQVSRTRGFWYGSPGIMEIGQSIPYFLALLSAFFCLVIGVFYASAEKQKHILEVLHASSGWKKLAFAKAAALLCSCLTGWFCIYGISLLVGTIWMGIPAQGVNMMMVTNLCNVFDCRQALALSMGMGLLGALALGILGFAAGCLFKSLYSALSFVLIVFLFLPVFLLPSASWMGLLEPLKMMNDPALFYWGISLFGKEMLVWPVWLIWWLSAGTLLLAGSIWWYQHKTDVLA